MEIDMACFLRRAPEGIVSDLHHQLPPPPNSQKEAEIDIEKKRRGVEMRLGDTTQTLTRTRDAKTLLLQTHGLHPPSAGDALQCAHFVMYYTGSVQWRGR